MEQIRYRKIKGWSGTVYQVRMSKKEIEERRKLGLFVSIVTFIPTMIFVMAFAAGMLG